MGDLEPAGGIFQQILEQARARMQESAETPPSIEEAFRLRRKHNQRLQRIASTSEIRARISRLSPTEGKGPKNRMEARWLADAERELILAEERDAIQATRPPGCWCLGIGGIDEYAIPDPDGETYTPGYRTYCECQEGLDASEEAAHAQIYLDRIRRERRLARMVAAAGIPGLLQGATFENFRATSSTREIAGSVQDYALTGSGSVLLWGDFGVGKSWLGVAALKVWAAREQEPTMFVTATDLMDAIRDTFNHETGGATTSQVISEIKTVPFLVLDDLGAENPTAWVKEQLFKILNHRNGERLPTVFTTNCNPTGDLPALIGPRVMERIIEMCGGPQGRIWQMVGPNHRLVTVS